MGRPLATFRPLLIALLVATFVATFVVLAPPAVAAPDAPAGDTSTSTTAPPAPDIIPQPNSGTPPEDAGDRGGALQIVLFVAVIGGIGVIAFLVWRESRKARAERGF